MRALIVDLSTQYGGASIRALELMQAFSPGEAALATLTNGPIAAPAAAAKLEVHDVGRRKSDPRVAARLARLLRAGDFQLIDAQNPQSKFWCSLAAARVPAALVSTLNSWYVSEHSGALRGRLYQMLERATARLTDMYVVVSADIQRRLVASGAPAEAVALIPNAVGVEPEAIAADREWLCAAYQLPPSARLCCSVGRLVEVKGYDCLIRSIAAAGDPDLHCLIVGDGPQRAELAALAASLGLGGRVRLLGFLERGQALKIVKAADVFVMSSRSEGMPLVLLEAAALARPIIATRVGGIPDVVTDGEHALLVESGDEVALAGALSRLYSDSAFAARLGARARERIARDYSPRAQVESTRRAYQTAWARSRKRLAR